MYREKKNMQNCESTFRINSPPGWLRKKNTPSITFTFYRLDILRINDLVWTLSFFRVPQLPTSFIFVPSFYCKQQQQVPGSHGSCVALNCKRNYLPKFFYYYRISICSIIIINELISRDLNRYYYLYYLNYFMYVNYFSMHFVVNKRGRFSLQFFFAYLYFILDMKMEPIYVWREGSNYKDNFIYFLKVCLLSHVFWYLIFWC